jgi:hypothetical protein
MGAVRRKTIPAMATTIVGFAAVRIPVHILRRDLIAANIKTISGALGGSIGPGDWVLSQTPTGTSTSGPPTNAPPAGVYHYIPAGRFWTVQTIEAAIFLVLTAALIAVCVTVVVRSRPH